MSWTRDGWRAFHGIVPGFIIKTDISLFRGNRCIIVPADQLVMLTILSIEPQDDGGADRLVGLHPTHGLIWGFITPADYRSRAFRVVSAC